MPSITSCRISFGPEERIDGVAVPLDDLSAGEPRGELIVGCERRLNMEVTGGAPEKVVCEGWRRGRLGNSFVLRVPVAADVGEACSACSSAVARVVPLVLHKGFVFPELDIWGVWRPLSESTSLERPLMSPSPRSFSCSSLISPSTRLTTFPTTSSLGWAATSRLPTPSTRSIN